MSGILNNLHDNDKNIRSLEILRSKFLNSTPVPESSPVSFNALSVFTNECVQLAIKVVQKWWKELNNIFIAMDKTFFKISEFRLSK